MKSQGEDWGALLADNPKVLWSLVADVVKAVKAGEGERRTGRRPAVSVKSLDELYEILFPPSYVEACLADALHHAMRAQGLSQRRLAEVVGFNQATLSRLLAGKSTPTVEMIERLAWALNVRPTYFSEYRALKLGQLVTDTLLADPKASADAIRRLFVGAAS